MKIKTIAGNVAWFTIGTVATVGYVSYKAGKSIVDDVPEMMKFAKDTYSQVKDVLAKPKSDVPKAENFDHFEDFANAVSNSDATIDELKAAQ